MAFLNKDQLLEALREQLRTNIPSEAELMLIKDGQYSEFVGQLAKDMGSMENDLMHMAVGIAGEAGELLDAIKKHWAYGKPIDLENVMEELGDLEFYMAGMRLLLNFTRSDCLLANREKLARRYGDSYSDEAAIARADKQPAFQEINMGAVSTDPQDSNGDND